MSTGLPTIVNKSADNCRQANSWRSKYKQAGMCFTTERLKIKNRMAIKFSLHNTPQPKGREGEQQTHARAIARTTQKMDDICGLVCQRASISSADVKAVLDSFVWVIGHSLKYGDNVELEGLGHFSPSLHTQQLPDGRSVVTVDNVNFRCSEKLKKELEATSLEKVKNAAHYLPEERKSRMLDYLHRNESITTIAYTRLNACSRYQATADLKKYLDEGLLCRVGHSTHVTYLLAENLEKQE